MTLTNPVAEARQTVHRECLAALQQSFEIGNKRGLVIMPPRLGEEHICARFVAHLLTKGAQRVLYLADQLVPLGYAARALRTQLGDTYTFATFRDGKAPDARVVFATYQAMGSYVGEDETVRLFEPDTFDVVVCFDCDRAGAEKFRQVVEYLDPKHFRLGFAPTPWRHDGTTIHDLFGEETYSLSLGAVDEREVAVIDYQNVLDRLQEEGLLVTPAGTAYAERVSRRQSIIPNRDIIIAQTINEIIAELSAKKALVVVPTIQSCKLMEKLLGGNAVALYDAADDKRQRQQLTDEPYFVAVVAHPLAALETIEFDVVFLLHNTEQLGGILRQVALGISREREDKPVIVRDLVGAYEGLVTAKRRVKTKGQATSAARKAHMPQTSEVLAIGPEAFQFRSYKVDLSALENSQRGLVQTCTLRGRITFGDQVGGCRMYRFTTESGMTEADCLRIARTFGRMESFENLVCYVSAQRDGVNAMIVFVWTKQGEEAGRRDERRLLSVFRRMSWLSELEMQAYPLDLAGWDLDALFKYLQTAKAELPSDRTTAMHAVVRLCIDRKQLMLADRDTAELYGWESANETLFKIVFGVSDANIADVYQVLLRDLKPDGFTAFRDDNDSLLAISGPGQLGVVRNRLAAILEPFGISLASVTLTEDQALRLHQEILQCLREESTTNAQLKGHAGTVLHHNAVTLYYWFSQGQKGAQSSGIASDLLFISPKLTGEALTKVRALLQKLRESGEAESLRGEEDDMLLILEPGTLDGAMARVIRNLQVLRVDFYEMPLPETEATQLWQTTLDIAKEKVAAAKLAVKPAGTSLFYNLQGSLHIGDSIYEAMVLRLGANPFLTSADADGLCSRFSAFQSTTTRAFCMATRRGGAYEVIAFLLCRGTVEDLKFDYAKVVELFRHSGLVSGVQERRYGSHLFARQDLRQIAEQLAQGDQEMQTVARAYVEPCLADELLWQP
ncbi:MAG TPA: DEAD/DEAH box helicase family protein [Candidatus Acidoferrum sp.]|nr:DEAD/DEAH box helicase family protein [Candidatus Acidoferrum sp.]